jgi:hypothetical protein
MPALAHDATLPVTSIEPAPSHVSTPPTVSTPPSLSSSPSPPTFPSLSGPASVSVPPSLSAPPKPRTALFAGVSAMGVVVILALVLVVRLSGKTPAADGGGTRPDAVTGAPLGTHEPVAGAPSVTAGDGKKRIKLVILPPDAVVEVEGQRVPVTDGLIDLEGAPGSIRRIRISKGTNETTGDVVITEIGAMPPKLELEEKPGAARGGTQPKRPKPSTTSEIIETFQ